MKHSKRDLVLKLIFFIILMIFFVFTFRGTNPDPSYISQGIFDLGEESFPLKNCNFGWRMGVLFRTSFK